MRIDILSKEYPPEIYGGAGVHVAELTRALRRRDDVDVRVRAFGGDRDEAGTWSYAEDARLRAANAALATMGVDLAMAADVVASPDGAPAADLVHSHTWYANLGGHVASLLGGVPHVVSAHSLEPLRPWKAEQLGGGYRLSSWIERTAYLSAARIIAALKARHPGIPVIAFPREAGPRYSGFARATGADCVALDNSVDAVT